jgi:threonine dehydratase
MMEMMNNITIEKHNGVYVLRDDLLPGGSKSILMEHILDDKYNEYVYASPVYGAFQIALSIWCKDNNKKATIFCAKRNQLHPNTIKCMRNGANVIEVECGYLTVVNKRAEDYCKLSKALKLEFGAKTDISKNILSNRMREIIKEIGHEPKEIWCPIGSGTLVESILMATEKSKVIGVQVGAEYNNNNNRLYVIKYNKPFDKPSTFIAPFPSMKNYDLKAWEMCMKYKKTDDVFFWNVYG